MQVYVISAPRIFSGFELRACVTNSSKKRPLRKSTKQCNSKWISCEQFSNCSVRSWLGGLSLLQGNKSSQASKDRGGGAFGDRQWLRDYKRESDGVIRTAKSFGSISATDTGGLKGNPTIHSLRRQSILTKNLWNISITNQPLVAAATCHRKIKFGTCANVGGKLNLFPSLFQ